MKGVESQRKKTTCGEKSNEISSLNKNDTIHADCLSYL